MNYIFDCYIIYYLVINNFFLKQSSTHLLYEAMDSDRSLEDKLNELLNFLSSNTIKNVPIDILDEKIFCTALPNAKNMYFEVRRLYFNLYYIYYSIRN